MKISKYHIFSLLVPASLPSQGAVPSDLSRESYESAENVFESTHSNSGNEASGYTEVESAEMLKASAH